MDFTLLKDLPDYALNFIQHLEGKGRKESTVQRYTYDLIDFLDWLEDEKGSKEFNQWVSLNLSDYRSFFDYLSTERSSSKRTMHRFRTVLNQIASYYKSEGYQVVSPKDVVVDSLTKDILYTSKDFVTNKELNKLMRSIVSPVRLSDRRLIARPFLINRNLSIISLFVKYGLTMNELSGLKMRDVNLTGKTLRVKREGYNREIDLDNEDALLLNYYLKDVPKPVRPRVNSGDPFFIAFDYYRGTYHWDYDNKKPKILTEVAIQKMIRGEIQKASFSRQITARHLRNTSILEDILNKVEMNELQKKYAFQTEWYIKRFLNYAYKLNPYLKNVYEKVSEKT